MVSYHNDHWNGDELRVTVTVSTLRFRECVKEVAIVTMTALSGLLITVLELGVLLFYNLCFFGR